MIQLILLRMIRNSKTELKIIGESLIILLLLPMFAVYSIAHTSLVSLSVSVVDDLYQGTLSPTDTYDWGNCTYWAALLRQQIGEPIPNGWGNAADWATNARLDGYLVDHTPSYGAIMQTSNVDNGLGHVAFVESVDPNTGSWTISEMNVKGFDVVDTQTLSAADAANYNFIHQN
jgi:surface antigen